MFRKEQTITAECQEKAIGLVFNFMHQRDVQLLPLCAKFLLAGVPQPVGPGEEREGWQLLANVNLIRASSRPRGEL